MLLAWMSRDQPGMEDSVWEGLKPSKMMPAKLIDYWWHLHVKYGSNITYMHTYIHTSVHPAIHTSIHPYIHASMHPWFHASMHPCIHDSMHPCIHASMHPWFHASMHPSIHPYICIGILSECSPMKKTTSKHKITRASSSHWGMCTEMSASSTLMWLLRLGSDDLHWDYDPLHGTEKSNT